MNIDKYALRAGANRRVFTFVSEGPKGAIQKAIVFEQVDIESVPPGAYNLAFGDWVNGRLNDKARSNNDDTDKVLATVVAAVYDFFDLYPDAFVYATGSTPARTRLYRMGIAQFYEEMQQDFYLYGRLAATKTFVDFELGTEYDAFLAQRRVD
jgi:hypothetical protein